MTVFPSAGSTICLLTKCSNRISTLPPGSAVFFGALAVDAKGVPLIDGQVFSRFREVSNAPMFGYEDTYFGADWSADL